MGDIADYHLEQAGGPFDPEIPVSCKHCRKFPLWWERDEQRASWILMDDHGRNHAPHCTAKVAKKSEFENLDAKP